MSSHKMHGPNRAAAYVERANDFKGTTKRLFGYFKTYKFQFIELNKSGFGEEIRT